MSAKIVFSTDTIGRGGKERQMTILASSLLNRDYLVYFLTKRVNEKDSYLNEYFIEKERVLVYKGIRAYSRIIKQLKPDLIVSWDTISSLFNLILYRYHKFCFINGSIRHGVRLLRISHLLRSLICRMSPYVMANSKEGLRVNNLKPDKRRFVIHNGIENKFLNTLSSNETEKLKKEILLDYDKQEVVYISVANFVPYKDYETVFRALSKLKLHIKFHYIIVGNGYLEEKIKKKITDYNLERNVLLVGKTEKVKKYLFAGDIMIHSSRGEGISNAIVEAMYAKLPVIATNVGGISETVFHRSSLLFPYKDDQSLYKCLLRSDELRYSINSNSEEYHLHLNKFSVESMVRRFEEIFHLTLGL